MHFVQQQPHLTRLMDVGHFLDNGSDAFVEVMYPKHHALQIVVGLRPIITTGDECRVTAIFVFLASRGGVDQCESQHSVHLHRSHIVLIFFFSELFHIFSLHLVLH